MVGETPIRLLGRRFPSLPDASASGPLDLVVGGHTCAVGLPTASDTGSQSSRYVSTKAYMMRGGYVPAGKGGMVPVWRNWREAA